jgi:hypothetical protein
MTLASFLLLQITFIKKEPVIDDVTGSGGLFIATSPVKSLLAVL